MKLTAKAVNALTLPPGKTDIIHFDDQLPGFGFRIRQGAGGKVLRSWVVQYRRASATRRMLLGSAEVVSAEAARQAARKALGAVANGQDPQGERAERRDADRLTLRKATDDFLAVKQRELRPRSFFETARYLTGAYFKPLHSIPLDTITRRDVATCIVRIARESGDPTASQARSKLSAFFAWCMRMGMVEANPVIGTHEPAKNKSRERVLSDDELSSIWRACGNDEYGKIVKLLILTGARRQEIGGMCWSEINFEAGTWTLPAHRSKNGRAHTLPVLPMMRQIIESVPRMATRDQLFGERATIGFTGWHDCKPDLDQHSGVTDEWHLHDVRRSVATRMADIGIAPHVIEQILNHQSGHKAGPAGIYNRSSYQREVRAALATWHDHLRTLVEGGERKVVAFPATAASGTPADA
jgi:integrase